MTFLFVYSAGKPVGVVTATPSVPAPESPTGTLEKEHKYLTSTPMKYNQEPVEEPVTPILSNRYSVSESNMAAITDSPQPTLMGRRKPPPKPPRMKNFLQHSKSLTDPRKSRRVRDTASPGRQSLRSALSEVTSVLDASITGLSIDDIETDFHVDQKMSDKKVYKIFSKSREILVHEIPVPQVTTHMFESGALSPRMREEILRTPDSEEQGQLLLDVVLTKGREDFFLFCDAVRDAGGKPYLSDLLLALDGLLEALSKDEERCPVCSCNNNMSPSTGDLTDDSPSFDIDINYCDKATGICMSVKDYLSEQKVNADILGSTSPLGEDGSLRDPKERERQPRFIPMVSANVYNQCLCVNDRVGHLVDVLLNRYCVRELSIAKCHLDSDGMDRLGAALQGNKSLAKLDIRLNTLGDHGADSLASGLRRNNSLRSLNITGTGLSGPGCGLLAHGLYKNHGLTELDIGFNDLQDSGCREISELLARDTVLRKLRMRDNNITPVGSSHMFSSLRYNSRLTTLDLSSNKVDDHSMSTLGEVLLVNRSLRELNLENCKIRSSACGSLARALKTNSTLRMLDMGMNPLGDTGVSSLADGMKYNHGLDSISLNMCRVGNLGFVNILEALKFNSSLATLKLCYNNIGLEPGARQRTSSSSNELDIYENIPARVGQRSDEDAESVLSDLSLDYLYDKLCRVLQQNKDLRVLLWGNRFCEPGARESFV